MNTVTCPKCKIIHELTKELANEESLTCLACGTTFKNPYYSNSTNTVSLTKKQKRGIICIRRHYYPISNRQKRRHIIFVSIYCNKRHICGNGQTNKGRSSIICFEQRYTSRAKFAYPREGCPIEQRRRGLFGFI